MIRTETQTARWTPIEGFPGYEISEMNEIRDISTGELLPKAEFNGVNYVELIHSDGKPYLQHVNRLRWRTFNLPGSPFTRTPFERHGEWLKNEERYSDGERSHLCGQVCSVGEV